MNISDIFNKSKTEIQPTSNSTPVISSLYTPKPAPVTNKYKIANRGIELSDDDLIFTLEYGIQYFIKEEQYENCYHLTEILKKIKEFLK